MPYSKEPESLVISEDRSGQITVTAPTFLERWGVVFLDWTGGWILAIGTALLIVYVWKQPPLPMTVGLTPEQATQALNVHRQLLEQSSESLTRIFDLLVTRTVLPISTLLLGYLFGKANSIHETPR